MTGQKRILLILVIFFLLRVIAVGFIGRRAALSNDSIQYNYYATTILKNFDWLKSSYFKGARREPGYPVFLASVYFFLGKENFLAVYIAQSLMSTLTVFIIYKLALKIFTERAAFMSFIWAGVYGFYMWFAAAIMRETLIIFFLILLFYLLHACLTDSACRKRKIFAASLIFVLLAHTDSRYLYLLPCIGILFIIYQSFLKGARNFCVFLLLAVVLSAPWAIRNHIAYDKFVFINDMYGDLGHTSIKGLKETRNYLYMGEINTIWKNPDYPTEEERISVRKGRNPKNRSADEVFAIKKGACATATFWGRKWFNLRELWRPFMVYGIYEPYNNCSFIRWSFRHNIFSIIFYGLLLPFVAIGIIGFAAKGNKDIWLLLLPVFFHTLFHVVTWGEYRYRIPIDSFLIILGGFGIAVVGEFFTGASRHLKRSTIPPNR